MPDCLHGPNCQGTSPLLCCHGLISTAHPFYQARPTMHPCTPFWQKELQHLELPPSTSTSSSHLQPPTSSPACFCTASSYTPNHPTAFFDFFLLALALSLLSPLFSLSLSSLSPLCSPYLLTFLSPSLCSPYLSPPSLLSVLPIFSSLRSPPILPSPDCSRWTPRFLFLSDVSYNALGILADHMPLCVWRE